MSDAEQFRFRTKTVEVDAVRLSLDNQMAVALWCNGTPVEDGCVTMRSVEGGLVARPGDFVIREETGYHHPCPPDVFADRYELVGDDG
jgi:hypothetical protein